MAVTLQYIKSIKHCICYTMLDRDSLQFVSRSRAHSDWMESVDVETMSCYKQIEGLQFHMRNGGNGEKCYILQELYQAHSFSMTADGNSTIVEAVQETMTKLQDEISRRDSRMSCDLVGVGSFSDGTRVGKAPNEFDYFLVLTGITKLITGCQSCGIGKYRFKVNDIDAAADAEEQLSNLVIRERLCELMDTSMRGMLLPQDLYHGGILSPCFSGVRKNGPAFTLLFLWRGGEHSSMPLLISVDVTVAIRPAHLEAYKREESKLSDRLLLSGLPVHVAEPQLYVIADPNQENVWQTSTAPLEVTIMKGLHPRLLRTIKIFKIIKDVFLTIREPVSDVDMTREITEHERESMQHLRGKMECLSKLFSSEFDESYQFIGKPSEDNLTTNKSLRGPIVYMTAARNMYLFRKVVCVRENIEIRALSDLMANICHRFLNKKKENRVQSYRDELDQMEGSRQPNLGYLPDYLPPYQCNLAFEDCKPLITLKSCVSKYVLLKLMLSGAVPWQSHNDGLVWDLKQLGLILKEIKDSRQLRHPLLGHPIITYSVSYRVQHCAGLNVGDDVSKRLSDILYYFIRVLADAFELKSSGRPDY